MFEHGTIQSMDDYFKGLNERTEKKVYFYRINSYSGLVESFLKKYYDAARKCGVVIEGKIPNPDEKNLSYYNEIMGMDFLMEESFINTSLKKWLPRMNDYQRQSVSSAIYDVLKKLSESGKNENMLKNAYIKFMCWLYYKFERVVNMLGENNVPKILYDGEIGNYELLLINVLSKSGCDVVFLQYNGDDNYKKHDPSSFMSCEMKIEGGSAFPKDYCIKKIRESIQEDFNNERIYGTKPKKINCTNAWVTENIIESLKKPFAVRGSDINLFYNVFYRMVGVPDKTTYVNDIYKLSIELKNDKRNVVIVDDAISQPTNEEISKIRRGNYQNAEQMLTDIVKNINFISDIELQRQMVKAFLDIMFEEKKKENTNLNKLMNRAVYLLCYLIRYNSMLFSGWNETAIPCFIHMGACRNEVEALFIRMLSKLPVDIIILCPNLNEKCMLEDTFLYEERFSETLNIKEFPRDNSMFRIGTAAYHAERELDDIMYQDSGMYRDKQYSKAKTINLSTMYEEIKILWDEELKYRPNFSVEEDTVNIPVIFSKISGVKDGNVFLYWNSVKELMTEDTFVIKNVPYISSTSPNQIKTYATEFYKNGKIQKAKIKNHQSYQYGFLREEIQDYILDKLQILIDSKIIKGTFVNGTEYTIVSTVLNLPKDIIRMIQKFDFTKKNPKIIYINTTEKMNSLEDSILMAFLNLIGFDVCFFVPTGYQTVENYFNNKIMEEHQIGQYVYDLDAPVESGISSNRKPKSWREKIFKRGV